MYKNDRISTSFPVEQSHLVARSLAVSSFLGQVVLGVDDDDDDDNDDGNDDDDCEEKLKYSITR